MSVFDPRRLLVVFAHPGDESMFAGNIISQALDRGVRVRVVTLTRGERGRTKLAELAVLNQNPRAMAVHRENELKIALDALGAPEHSFAGTRAYLDSGYRQNAWGQLGKPRVLDEMSLAATATAVVAEDILAELKDFRPDTVITHHSRGANVHPDHRAAYLATAMAIRKYRAENVAPDLFVTAEPGAKAEISVMPLANQAKREAIAAHRSQFQIRADGYSYATGSRAFSEPETLVRSSVNPLVRLLPLLTYFWALPLGALVAVAGTLIHQVRSEDATAWPIGLAIALTMIGSLALALRLLRNSRGALYLTSLAFLATIWFLAQRQGAGTVLIPANESGTIWAYGSLALLFLIMLFPNLSRSAWSRKAS